MLAEHLSDFAMIWVARLSLSGGGRTVGELGDLSMNTSLRRGCFCMAIFEKDGI